MTKKQKRFVEEYLIDLNATQAAIRAGYSTATAKDIGCENLAKPNIRDKIDKALAERSKRTGVTADRVIQELAKIAFVNAEDVINFETGGVRADADKEDLAVIQSVKVKEMSGEKGDSTEREVKLADKQRALELLGKHLGMFSNDINVSMKNAIQVELVDDVSE